MSFDTTQVAVGEELQENVQYIFRITNVGTVASKSGNLRLNVTAVVASGPSAGVMVPFPAYKFMIADRVGGHAKTPTYITRTTNLAGKILDVPVQRVPSLPTHPKEVAPLNEALVNALFKGTVKYNPGDAQYEGRWELDRVICSVMPSEIEALPQTDWGSVFDYEVDDTDED